MGEGMMGRGGGGEWGDEGGGVMGGGGWPGGVGDTRGHRVTTPGTPGSQWLPSGSKDSWGKKVCAPVFLCTTYCVALSRWNSTVILLWEG